MHDSFFIWLLSAAFATNRQMQLRRKTFQFGLDKKGGDGINDVMTDSIVVIQRFFFNQTFGVSIPSWLVLFQENKAKSFHHPGI